MRAILFNIILICRSQVENAKPKLGQHRQKQLNSSWCSYLQRSHWKTAESYVLQKVEGSSRLWYIAPRLQQFRFRKCNKRRPSAPNAQKRTPQFQDMYNTDWISIVFAQTFENLTVTTCSNDFKYHSRDSTRPSSITAWAAIQLSRAGSWKKKLSFRGMWK